MENNEDYKQLLSQICVDINNCEEYSKKKYNLFGSNASLILFLAYCQKYDILPKKNNLIIFLNDYIDSLNEIEVTDATLGSGLSGAGWLIQNLVSINTLNYSDYNESLIEFDNLIYKSITHDKTLKNYDLFMGLIGKGVYFLSRYYFSKSISHLNYIVEITNLLLSFSISDNNKLIWIGRLQSKDESDEFEDSIVLGFAHGLPSILNFLSKVFTISPSKEIENSIYQLVDTLSSYQRMDNTKNKWFPHYITNGVDYPESYSKRLAWCYGDLGLCYSLLCSAYTLNDVNLITNAEDQLIKLAEYSNLKESQIYDAGFCHGASGVGHIFYKSYCLSNKPIFLKASKYWFSVVKDFQNHSDSKSSGFKTFRFTGDEVFSPLLVFPLK